jgi:predicted DCC family thiol-disulfide oxidoreductase YuxK
LKKTIILYYDKECPFCKEYTKLLKLKKDFVIVLKDARVNFAEISKVCNELDINDGFIVLYENKSYQGPKALQFLNTAVDKNTFIGKLHFLFKYENIFSHILYKVFFTLRKLIFFFLKKNDKIGF